MTKLRLLAIALIALFFSFGIAASPSDSQVPQNGARKATVSTEVRKAARKLAYSWVDTAGAQTLDQLANRSIAFAGMVPGLFLELDGKRLSATQVLMDSALTIIKSNVNEADAAAIRNIVYALMEIAEGRAIR